MAQAIAAILAVAKAIPILNEWMGRLLEAYAKQQKLKVVKETIEAVDDAFESQDQRGLESQEHSGQYSGHGTIRKPPTAE